MLYGIVPYSLRKNGISEYFFVREYVFIKKRRVITKKTSLQLVSVHVVDGYFKSLSEAFALLLQFWNFSF